MKDPDRQAGRWLRQARYDLAQAEQLLQQANYAYAAFFAEQAAQKALEGYLISRGRRYVMIHSVGELAREAMSSDPEFERLVEHGRRLDRHYLTTRYPDALPDPIIPAEAYGREDAEQAVSDAQAVLNHVLRRLGGDAASRVS